MRAIGSEEAGLDETDALGGANGFEELAQSARPALVRVAQAVTGHREDAEDAVQASLVKAMGAWPRVAGQERWRQQAYVRQIVVNTCRSGWRKWGSRVAVGDLPELAQAPKTDAVDDRALVSQALARLPARQREVLVLRYFEDLSEAEIAKCLGCAPGTVKSSAARALRALRDMLPEYAGGGLDSDRPAAGQGERADRDQAAARDQGAARGQRAVRAHGAGRGQGGERGQGGGPAGTGGGAGRAANSRPGSLKSA